MSKKKIVMVAKKSTAVAMAATTAISSAAILPQAFAAENTFSGIEGRLKNDWGTIRMEITVKGEGKGMYSKPIITDEKSFVENTKITINGEEFKSMKENRF